MARFIASFVARQPGNVPVESSTNAPPIRIEAGFVHISSEGREVLVVRQEDFLGIALAAEAPRIVTPGHGMPDA